MRVCNLSAMLVLALSSNFYYSNSHYYIMSVLHFKLLKYPVVRKNIMNPVIESIWSFPFFKEFRGNCFLRCKERRHRNLIFQQTRFLCEIQAKESCHLLSGASLIKTMWYYTAYYKFQEKKEDNFKTCSIAIVCFPFSVNMKKTPNNLLR